MALIKCADCDKEISDQAGACPGCGAPTPLTLEAERAAEREQEIEAKKTAEAEKQAERERLNAEFDQRRAAKELRKRPG